MPFSSKNKLITTYNSKFLNGEIFKIYTLFTLRLLLFIFQNDKICLILAKKYFVIYVNAIKARAKLAELRYYQNVEHQKEYRHLVISAYFLYQANYYCCHIIFFYYWSILKMSIKNHVCQFWRLF